MGSNYFAFWRSQIVVIVLIVLGASGWRAISEEQRTIETHRIPIAVIDIARVFKEARAFNDKMQALKSEVEAVDKDVRTRTQQVESLTTKADNTVGSAQAQQQAAKMLAEAALLVKRQEFLQKETDVYADTYGTIEKLVARISKARDIGVVLRISTDGYSVADRNSVLQAVNRPIVYSAIPDLTEEVVTALNEQQP